MVKDSTAYAKDSALVTFLLAETEFPTGWNSWRDCLFDSRFMEVGKAWCWRLLVLLSVEAEGFKYWAQLAFDSVQDTAHVYVFTEGRSSLLC